MIVCSRQEFYQDLSYDSDPRPAFSGNRNHIKFVNQITAHFFELAVADASSLEERNHPLFPYFVLPVDNSLFLFIRAHTVNALHKKISEHRTIAYFFHQRKRQLKARIAFQTAQIQRDDRNLLHIGFFQSPSDKSYIVGSTAAASCLGHNNCCFIQIIFAG